MQLRRPDGGVEEFRGPSEFPGAVYGRDPFEVDRLFDRLRGILQKEEADRRNKVWEPKATPADEGEHG